MAFKKGHSGNPAGRKPGTKNKAASLAAELAALNKNAVEMVVKAIEAAMEDGDYASAAKLLDRMLVLIYPAPQPEPQEIHSAPPADPRFSDEPADK